MMTERSIRLLFTGTIALALLATACGGGGDENPPPNGNGPSFETIKEGVITVANCLDYPPFESIRNGDEVGFDVDLTEAIARKLGLQVDWVKAEFGPGMFTAVATGQYDMAAAAITATGPLGEKRAQTVDFSDFYFTSLQSFAVNPEKTPDIESTDDLKSGDVVGAQKNTTGEDWAITNLGPQGVEVKSYATAPDAFRDLAAGAIVGVVNDEASSSAIVKDFPGLAVVQTIEPNEKYAFAFSPDNPSLREAWNGGFQEVIDDGTYARLFKQYFPNRSLTPEFEPAQ